MCIMSLYYTYILRDKYKKDFIMAMMKTGTPATQVNTETVRGYQDGLQGTSNPPSDPVHLQFYNQGFDLGQKVKNGQASKPIWA
jgi:hypothetical protein